jgi:hypothetical protein
VCVFDALHHFGQPSAALAAVRASLREGGSLLVAESSLSGNPTTDAADPMGILMYGSDLLYCFQESKADGGVGLGATWAGDGLEGLLVEQRFGIAATHVSDAGYAVVRAIPTGNA